MSETPRTDAQDIIIPSDLSPEELWNHNAPRVSADFARDLERKLAEARKAIRPFAECKIAEVYENHERLVCGHTIGDLRRAAQWMKDNPEK